MTQTEMHSGIGRRSRISVRGPAAVRVHLNAKIMVTYLAKPTPRLERKWAGNPDFK
ncbi:hypothetical protein D3C78_1836270 [compost metagenome]